MRLLPNGCAGNNQSKSLIALIIIGSNHHIGYFDPHE
ncbi:hypothetical protein J2X14_001711 [Pantoea alhagi]|nr:hypothetical protein [Pantoea alhagi]